MAKEHLPAYVQNQTGLEPAFFGLLIVLVMLFEHKPNQHTVIDLATETRKHKVHELLETFREQNKQEVAIITGGDSWTSAKVWSSARVLPWKVRNSSRHE